MQQRQLRQSSLDTWVLTSRLHAASTDRCNPHDTTTTSIALNEVLWPKNTIRLYSNENPSGIQFDGDVEQTQCGCVGFCKSRTCSNAARCCFCDTTNCNVGIDCGNRGQELRCLRLIGCTVGLGVGTVAILQPGTIVGEYCGVLRKTQSGSFRKTGFELEMKSHSIDGSRIIVDASKKGSLCRFINHSCVPNCRLEEWENGRARKIFVITGEQLSDGHELTVSYCKHTWFRCRCAACLPEFSEALNTTLPAADSPIVGTPPVVHTYTCVCSNQSVA